MKKFFPFLILFALPGLLTSTETRVKLPVLRVDPYLKAMASAPCQQKLGSFAFYSSELRSAILSIQQLPECRKLIEEIQKGGLIGVQWSPFGKEHSDAVWYGQERVIIVNSSKALSDGEKICSILFEMHNALANQRFLEMDLLAKSQKITKDHYVETIERIEHQNAIKTMALLDKGVKMGVFPSTSQWPILRNFDDHYKIQQLMGHSYQIALIYNGLNPNGSHLPYQGTIPSIEYLSEMEKQQMMHFLSIKDRLEHGSQKEKEQAQLDVRKAYDQLKNRAAHHHYNDRQLAIFFKVFEGCSSFEKMKKKFS